MPSDIVSAELFALGMAPRESRIWHKEQRETAKKQRASRCFPSPAIFGNRGFPRKPGCRSLIILCQNRYSGANGTKSPRAAKFARGGGGQASGAGPSL